MTLDDLIRTLRRLREPWPMQWPGLPVVFAACVAQLDQGWGARRSVPVMTLLQSGLGIAASLETLGAQMAAGGREPAYHSRLHTADAMVCLTALLMKQRTLDGRERAAMRHAEAMLLVTMVGHDALHDGRRNSHACELEQISVDYVLPILRANGVRDQDCHGVGELILATDPQRVSRQHALAQRRPFGLNSRLWQSVVIEEADILASALPEFQAALTQQLAAEWARYEPASSRSLLSPGSRQRFLRQAACFSSPAACALGLPELVQRQIDELQV
jgi:hypothetical protein